jgi:hypothetical protein
MGGLRSGFRRCGIAVAITSVTFGAATAATARSAGAADGVTMRVDCGTWTDTISADTRDPFANCENRDVK